MLMNRLTKTLLAAAAISPIFMNCSPSPSKVKKEDSLVSGLAEPTGITNLVLSCQKQNEQNPALIAVFPAFDKEWTTKSENTFAQFDANLTSALQATPTKVDGSQFLVRASEGRTTITLTSNLTAFEKRQLGADQIKFSIAQRRPRTLVTATLTKSDNSTSSELACSLKEENFSLATRSEIVKTAEEFIANTIGNSQNGRSADPKSVTFFNTQISYAKIETDGSGSFTAVVVRTLADFPSLEGSSDCSTVVRIDSPSQANADPSLSAQDMECDIAD